MNGNVLVEERVRESLANTSRRLHERGWVANHDGNITVQLEANRILTTPTGVSKGGVGPSSLVTVDGAGTRIAGRNRSFSELGLHLVCYAERPDVRVVLHAHPPSATGLAVAGVPLDLRIMPEPIISLGEVPTVPFAPPGKEAEEALRPFLSRADAFLLANHGVLTVAADLETAFLRMELVEHVARIILAARAAGGARTIPEKVTAALLEKRRKAGLGPPPPRATTGGARVRSTARATTVSNPGSDLRAIIAAEVARVLREG